MTARVRRSMLMPWLERVHLDWGFPFLALDDAAEWNRNGSHPSLSGDLMAAAGEWLNRNRKAPIALLELPAIDIPPLPTQTPPRFAPLTSAEGGRGARDLQLIGSTTAFLPRTHFQSAGGIGGRCAYSAADFCVCPGEGVNWFTPISLCKYRAMMIAF